MSSQTTTYDVAVLGSGIGGMTAAVAMAKKGHSVALIEAAKAFGGMLHPFKRKKYLFDVGLHYIGECGPKGALRRILDELRIDVQFREIDPEGFDRYIFPEYEGVLCKGIENWAARLSEQFPKERENIYRFVEFMLAVEGVMRMAWRGPSKTDLKRIAKFPTHLVRMIYQPFGPLLDHFFEDRALKNIIAGPGGDLGLPPSRVSSFSSILLLTHYLGGAYYPIGGTHRFCDAYVDALQREGVDMFRKQPVIAINKDTDGFRIRTAADTEYRARTVISNIDAVDTFKLLHDAKPWWFVRRKAAKTKPSLGSIMVFLGVDMDLSKTKVTEANIWHYSDDDIDGAYEGAERGIFPEEPMFFLTAPSLKDPDVPHGPPGHHTVELISMAPPGPFEKWFDAPVHKRGEEYESFKTVLGNQLIDAAERLYLPGLRDSIQVQEIATPATNISYVNARMGGIYGPEHTPNQTFFRRFLPVTGVDGLFLAGASVLGGGIMPCTMSGMMAAKMARGFLKEKKAA